jgi:hypothetical protein
VNRVRALFVACSVGAGFVLSACGDDSPTALSSSAIVTFAVQGETFRASLTNAAQVAAAHAAQRGGPARIPIGRIVSGAQVNTGWSWHLEDLTFAQVTIELCDGRPSDVEREGTLFGEGRFCLWTAVVVHIEDR